MARSGSGMKAISRLAAAATLAAIACSAPAGAADEQKVVSLPEVTVTDAASGHPSCEEVRSLFRQSSGRGGQMAGHSVQRLAGRRCRGCYLQDRQTARNGRRDGYLMVRTPTVELPMIW